MTHDDFCINPNQDDDTCIVCDLIARVRRDEQDIAQGDQELDIEGIKAQAYQQGYDRGYKENTPPPPIEQTPIDIDYIKKYILNNINTFSLEQTNALYGLYTSLGGK